MTKIGIILGRFNPPHKGHYKLGEISLRDNDVTYFVIIQGEDTGKDRKRNPLTFTQKKLLIHDAQPDVVVVRYKAAAVPEIITEILRSLYSNEREFHFVIYTGSDRVAGYANQLKPKYIAQIIKDLDEPDYKITAEIRAVEREESSKSVEGYSASKVRAAIRNGKDELAMAMMGITDKNYFKQIKAAVLAGLQTEEIEKMINIIMEKING